MGGDGDLSDEQKAKQFLKKFTSHVIGKDTVKAYHTLKDAIETETTGMMVWMDVQRKAHGVDGPSWESYFSWRKKNIKKSKDGPDIGKASFSDEVCKRATDLLEQISELRRIKREEGVKGQGGSLEKNQAKTSGHVDTKDEEKERPNET